KPGRGGGRVSSSSLSLRGIIKGGVGVDQGADGELAGREVLPRPAQSPAAGGAGEQGAGGAGPPRPGARRGTPARSARLPGGGAPSAGRRAARTARPGGRASRVALTPPRRCGTHATSASPTRAAASARPPG